MATNPYVFVTGCARSGTLLQRMLDSHPQLAVSSDTHVLPRTLLRLDPPDPNLPLTDDLVREVVGYKRFDRIGIDPETAWGLAATADTFPKFVQGLFHEFARRRCKGLRGRKGPTLRSFSAFVAPLLSRGSNDPSRARRPRCGAVGTRLGNADRIPPRLALWREEPVAWCALWWGGRYRPAGEAVRR